VIPILTVAQMRAADGAAVSRRGTEALVRAAGTAVALEAKRMLGRCYGARVAVIEGPGLNGADGRVAVNWLRSRGARVDVIAVANQPRSLDGYQLVIDAAFGLGCSRPYEAPHVSGGTKVLAVDLPSGVDSDSGSLLGTPMRADVTIALGALKWAHLTGPSVSLVGELRFAGLGIVSDVNDGVMEDDDLSDFIVGHGDDHKWLYAMQVLAGSPAMPGAAEMVVRGALAGGASMIRLTSRGDVASMVRLAPEVVHADDVVVDRRCRVVVAGPGLGVDAASWLAERLDSVEVPVVLDADGLDRSLIAREGSAADYWILTPHDGEFARLTGEPVPPNRIEAVRRFARETGCVVLLKGSLTILADPKGKVRVVRSGTSALSTAGSGDVLAGLIGATIARGHDTLNGAAMAAHLHGLAGRLLAPYATASDLPGAIRDVLIGLVDG